MLTRTIITTGMLLAFVVSVAMPRPARAVSLADPPPLLNGTTKGKTVYSVPYLRNDSGDTAFCVACTSTQKTGGKNFLTDHEQPGSESVRIACHELASLGLWTPRAQSSISRAGPAVAPQAAPGRCTDACSG